MRKRRFIYYIFSVILSIVILTLTFIYPEYTFPGLLLMVAVMTVNFYFRRKERDISNQILAKYAYTCDPDEYIKDLQLYASKCFLTKRQRLNYSLYYAIAYIDSGDFEKAKELLLYLDENEQYLEEVSLLLYLKAWSDYFYFQYDDAKMKEILLQMKEIIVNSHNNNFKMNYSVLYTAQEAKYYILTGENLEKVREFFEKKRKAVPTVLSFVKNTYLIALTDIRLKKYDNALVNLKKMYESKKKQYVVYKGKELYLELKEILEGTPNNKLNN